MRRSVWMWRWRSNPLRSRSYAVEAWALLAAGLVTVVCASVAGVAADRQARDRLDAQRAGRHPTAAVLVEDAGHSTAYTASAVARVRWTAPDGTSRTDVAKVTAGLARGTAVTVWTDRRGELAAAPASVLAERADSVLTGLAAGTGVCLLALTGCAVATRLTDRRRAEQWGREWDETGPLWDRRTA